MIMSSMKTLSIIEQNDFDYNIMEFKGRIYLADGKTFPKITDLSIKEIIITDYQDSEKRATLLRFDSSDNVKIFDLVEENSKISMDTEGINELYKIKCALDDYDSFSLGEYIIAEYNGKLYLRINSIGYFEIASYYSDLFYI